MNDTHYYVNIMLLHRVLKQLFEGRSLLTRPIIVQTISFFGLEEMLLFPNRLFSACKWNIMHSIHRLSVEYIVKWWNWWLHCPNIDPFRSGLPSQTVHTSFAKFRSIHLFKWMLHSVCILAKQIRCRQCARSLSLSISLETCKHFIEWELYSFMFMSLTLSLEI